MTTKPGITTRSDSPDNDVLLVREQTQTQDAETPRKVEGGDRQEEAQPALV